MKGIALALILISPLSFADWGDVYYCQMTTFSETSFEGKRTDYVLQKFQFKLDKTKNAMVFGQGGFFNGSVKKINGGTYGVSREYWDTDDDNRLSTGTFNEGKFLYALVAGDLTSMSADCDKF